MIDDFPFEEVDFTQLADLKVKAMLFNMDIDWEILDLVPKASQKAPNWLTRWKNKQAEADFDNALDAEQE